MLQENSLRIFFRLSRSTKTNKLYNVIRTLSIPFIFLCTLCFVSCQPHTKTDDAEEVSDTHFAKGFSIKKYGTYTEVIIKEPYPNAPKAIRYLLVPKHESIPPHDNEVQVIRTPIESIVCTSTSHIALLDQLNAIDLLVGFPSTDLISTSRARAQIDAGKVTELGIDNNMNMELLIALQPELVMGYSLAGDLSKLDKLKEFGIPMVINAEYLEDHPLGRAEWIKYFALFIDKEQMADSIFTTIKNEYLKSEAIASQVTSKPTVMSGILYGDAWFLPGGKNYMAKLFSDAGYRYLWEDDSSNGFLKLSFETVLAKGETVDYWIGVGSFKSLSEMKSAEERYSLFRVFNDGGVYTYDARKGATGGSEYLELGYARPDIVLKDLIKIAHPELVPDHKLYFHKKLE